MQFFFQTKNIELSWSKIIDQMKSITKASIFFLLIITFFSCNDRTDLISQVPKDISGIGKIDLPGLKNKALSWDLIYGYLFSDDENNDQVDWALDVDRVAYFYTTKGSVTLLIPVTDLEKFETAVSSVFQGDILKQNGYSYTRGSEFFVGWKKDWAVISNTINFTDPVTEPLDSLLYLKDQDNDVYFSYSGDDVIKEKVAGNLALNFNDGEIGLRINGDSVLMNLLKKELVWKKKITKLNLDYDAFVSVSNNKELTLEVLRKGLPFLQEYGLIFSDQLKGLAPSLTGEVQLGLEKTDVKPNTAGAQLVLGVKEVDAVSKILDSTWIKDKATGFYMDEEGFQFIKIVGDKLILSNRNLVQTTFEKSNSLACISINKHALKGDYLAFTEMRFGSEAVTSFPVKNVKLDVEKASGSTGKMLLKASFRDNDKNSLVSLLEYFMALNKEEEI